MCTSRTNVEFRQRRAGPERALASAESRLNVVQLVASFTSKATLHLKATPEAESAAVKIKLTPLGRESDLLIEASVKAPVLDKLHSA